MLQARTMTELFEVMTSKKATEEELHGRTSGSVAWRRIRGELGVDSDNKVNSLTTTNQHTDSTLT